MPLTWLDLSVPPINLWNFPAWEVPLTKTKESIVIDIKLTEAELEAFKLIYRIRNLQEYLDIDEETGAVEQNAFATLFSKLGINLPGVQDV